MRILLCPGSPPPIATLCRSASNAPALPASATGSLTEYTLTPVLEYRDNLETWTVLPVDSEITNVSYQFLHPGVPFQDGFTITIRDKNIQYVTVKSQTMSVIRATESSEATSLQPGSSESIVDGFGNFWSVDDIGLISLNGTVDKTASGCINMYYSNHTIFYQNRNQLWFKRPDLNKQWILSASPYINGPNSEQTHLIASQQSLDFLISQLSGLLKQLQPVEIID